MATRKCSLPLGMPAAGTSYAYMTHLKSVLVADESDFGSSKGGATFTLSGGAEAADRKVLAIWDGHYTIHNKYISTESFPDVYVHMLRRTYGSQVPVPKKIIYGPVNVPDKTMDCRPGDLIGELDGDAFFVTLQDKNGFYVNAYTMLEFFRSIGVFDMDDSWEFPFTRNNVSSDHEILFLPNQDPAESYMKISGGSSDTIIYNPPQTIPPDIFSFISSDTIKISVNNISAGQQVKVIVQDISHEMYRAQVAMQYSHLGDQLSFVPQRDLKAFHKPYNSSRTANNNGKKQVGKPLMYQVSAYIDEILTFQTTIEQETRDVIRQEYLFHSIPFQATTQLPVPALKAFNRGGTKSAFFASDIFNDHSNYTEWLLNADVAIHVAEVMRRKFTDQVLELYESGMLVVPAEMTSYDLKVNSSWRNPERNEKSHGVQNSNHQFGEALDLASRHAITLREPDRANPVNIALHYAMFQAGKAFLAEMIAINGAQKCKSMEIILERSSDRLLSYTTNNAGVISMNVKDKYDDYVNYTPAGDTDIDKICAAAEWASHVHVGWKAHGVEELEFPPTPSYEDIDIVPTLPFKNIIVIATEAADVPAAQQLPLLHVAYTIRAYLDQQPGAVETYILEISNPIEYLEAMSAFNPLFRVNYFFSMGHAYPYGLILKHTVNPINDPDLEKRIRHVYGTETPFGSNDFTEFKVNQFRVSNIRLLPGEMVTNVRAIFKKARGVFILGCNAANTQDATDKTFVQEFATLIDQPVYGAGYYSKVFHLDDEEWEPVDINRSDAYDATKKYVLAPNERGTTQYLKYLFDHFDVPENFHPSEALDLFEFYKQSLELVFPEPALDKERVQNVTDPHTVDTD
jgi:hypothetical protein